MSLYNIVKINGDSISVTADDFYIKGMLIIFYDAPDHSCTVNKVVYNTSVIESVTLQVITN